MLKEKYTELIKNKTYLYLLVNYNNKILPSYVQLAKELGLSRQTVSKQVNYLIDEGILELSDEKIVFIDNVLDIDIEKLGNVIKNDNYLIKDVLNIIKLNTFNYNFLTANQVCEKYHISKSTLFMTEKQVIVYGIISEGIIKYVGSTSNYENRIKQHILKRPFLDKSNFVILKATTTQEKNEIEKILIKTLQPEWNDMSK